MRLRSDIWVSAYIRRCIVENMSVYLRVRGSAEAGAIFVRLDLLNGQCVLFGPAPQSAIGDDGPARLFSPLHANATIDTAQAAELLSRQLQFDPDAWVIDVDDDKGRHLLDLA